MNSYWNFSLKGLLLNILIFLLILTLTNSNSIRTNEETALTDPLKLENKELKPWEKYKVVEHGRKKRELFTVTTITLLVVWSMVVGPFVQMQLTGNINLIGTFKEENGCAHRFISNFGKGKSWCAPTDTELINRRFLIANYVTIFEDISQSTEELLEELYDKMVGFEEFSPFVNAKKLTRREQLFFFLYKNQFISMSSETIPETLLNEKEDKYAWMIHQDFKKQFKGKKTLDCKTILTEWDKIKKSKKTNGYIKSNEQLEDLFNCGCGDVFKNWEEIPLETIQYNLKPTECLDIMSAYNLTPEGELATGEQNEGSVNVEEYADEKTPLLKESASTVGEKMINNIEDNDKIKKLKVIYKLFLREIINLDSEKLKEFIQTLDHLLVIEKVPDVKMLDSFLSSIGSLFSSKNEEPTSVHEDFSNRTIETKMILIDFDSSEILKNTLSILNGTPMFQALIKNTYEQARESKFFQELNETNVSDSNDLYSLKLSKQSYLLLEIRKNICYIFDILKKVNECQILQHKKYKDKKQSNERNNQIGICNMFPSLLPSFHPNTIERFDTLCIRFRQQNKEDRDELPKFEDFENSDEDMHKFEFEFDIDKLEKELNKLSAARFKDTEIKKKYESDKEEGNNDITLGRLSVDSNVGLSHGRLSVDSNVNQSKKLNKTKSFLPSLSQLNRLKLKKILTPKKVAEINQPSLQHLLATTLRKKRFVFEIQLIALGGALLFQQFYKALFKKVDPLKMLFECINNYDSQLGKCKPSSKPDFKEITFIREALEIVTEKMSLHIIEKLRKLYEIFYIIHIQFLVRKKGKIDKKANDRDKMPSEFLGKLGLKLQRLHARLLDCHFYDWKDEMPNGMINKAKVLTQLVKNARNHCKLFGNFIDKAERLKPIWAHPSMTSHIFYDTILKLKKKKLMSKKEKIKKISEKDKRLKNTIDLKIDPFSSNDTKQTFPEEVKPKEEIKQNGSILSEGDSNFGSFRFKPDKKIPNVNYPSLIPGWNPVSVH